MVEKIILVGDLCPNKTDEILLAENRIEEVFGDVLPILKDADIVIANMETPICSSGRVMKKCGPSFCVSEDCLDGIVSANIKYLSMANNHIKDYGNKGIIETIKNCQKKQVKTIGVGKTFNDAAKPLIIELNSMKVGVIAAAENEGQIATDNEAGVPPIDVYYVSNEIKKLDKLKCKFKIVILHGGREFYRFPIPRMKKISRQIIDEGADCIIWHHTHCSSGFEFYKGKFISYGVGNFLFDYDIKYTNFFKSYLVEISIRNHKNITYRMIPYTQHYGKKIMRLMDGKEAEDFFNEIGKINNIIADDSSLEKEWNQFCDRVTDSYLSELLGYSRILKLMNMVMEDSSNKSLYKQYGVLDEELLKLSSMLTCETHRDIFANVIKRFVNKGEQND